METKKISKWEAAPESIKNMRELVNALYDPLPDERNPIIDALSKVLNDYNKLEAKHQLDCGLISDYAEENAQLKPQLYNLREKLKEAERSKENWHAKWTELSDICSTNEDDYEMLQRMLEKDGYTVEYDGDIDDETVHCRCTSDYILRGTTPDEVTLQFGRWTLTRPQTFSEAEANAKVAKLTAKLTESEFDLAELKEALDKYKAKNEKLEEKHEKATRYISRLTEALNNASVEIHYVKNDGEGAFYVDSVVDKCAKRHYEEQSFRLRNTIRNYAEQIRCSKKVISVLEKEIAVLKRNKLLAESIATVKRAQIQRDTEDVRKQTHELKDTPEKDGEFAKFIGNRIVECIKRGAEYGYYELHPLNRFDIHIEETRVTPMQDRHAIPKIAVQCNNIQTEMERDTAEHECEELNKKVDRLWCVNGELNRKIKELAKENVDLKRTLSMCERDANTAKNLCDGIASNVERAGIRTPWYDDTSRNSRYLRRQGDDF